MPRKKVRMGFIENTSRRKLTYKTRVECLMKKAKELSTLCGVVVCSVVYGPFEPEPKVWTTGGGATASGVYAVLRRYYQQTKSGKIGKMANQVTFVREIINRVDEQVKKQQGLNHGKFITELMLRCIDFNNNNNNNNNLEELPSANLNALDKKVRRQLSDVDKRIMELSVAPVPAPPPAEPVVFPLWLISWIIESCYDDDDFVPFGGQLAPNIQLDDL